MLKTHRLLIALLTAPAFLSATHFVARADDANLPANFANPPVTSRPETWWHWINGNVTKEGITADLESMKRVGMGGATIVNIGGGPDGPVDFMSDRWRQLVQHAVHESARLGLSVGVENCAGWSSSGGPWITPAYGMQMVTFSSTQVKGGAAFTGTLPPPVSRLDTYHDIAVVAFPTPASALVRMKDFSPTITSNSPLFHGENLLREGGRASLAGGGHSRAEFVQVEFPKPFAVRTVVLAMTRDQSGNLQASDDGVHFRSLRTFHYQVEPGAAPMGPALFEIPPTSARFYRINFLRARKPASQFAITELDLQPRAAIDDIRAKTYVVREEDIAPASSSTLPPGEAIDPAQVVNLTADLSADGRLHWTPPAGDWTVLRFGYTPIGVLNHPAPKTGEGLEVDKLSRAALKFHWDHMMAKIVADSGPLAGTALNHTLIDSYEVGCQNWTAGMEQEFQKRQGYDLTPFLPAIAGWVVGSPEQSDRVLWDFRRTIGDLFDENYFDYMGELARQSGLQLATEPYGDGSFDSIAGGRGADMPMDEFWAPGPDDVSLLKGVAGISHLYGHPLTAAESFTGNPQGTRWQMDPAILKPIGDLAFASGVNHMFFHRFAHQPWLDRVPGMTAGQWGTMLERTNTWWEQSAAWMHYLARCQYLLQQGLFVGDALLMTPEGSPAGFSTVQVPTGYAADSCNDDVLLHRVSVKDGRLVLPDGMSYRVLVLPPGPAMTPELMQKVSDLVAAGATVIGTPPSASPSFRGFPQCDAQVKSLAAPLWQNGKITDRALDAEFAALNLPPDFECADPDAAFLYLHRAVGDRDIYFVANQHGLFHETDCLFRVTGKVPELWHPETGRIEPVGSYSDKQGRTRVHLRLDPVGSVFVVFQPATAADHPIALAREGGAATKTFMNELRITHAVYQSTEDSTASADVTAKLNGLISNGALIVTAGNAALGDPAPNQVKQLHVEYTLNGQPAAATVAEGTLLDLPQSIKRAEFADAALVGQDGAPAMLQAWQPGTYDVKFSGGKSSQVQVADLPAPVTLSGSWQLAFQPKRGAPATATFASLASWSDQADTGIKYFSGTATYTKSFQVPPALLGADRRLYLDLGDVEVIAQVKLNGQDLGVLWKPPFGLDVTNAVKPGANDLEVQVTNLWVNRLIGDEQLPPDSDFGPDHTLKAWPQWLLDDKPSPTGRITFTTYHHWDKGDALKPSGLLGPVRLIPSVVKPLP